MKIASKFENTWRAFVVKLSKKYLYLVFMLVLIGVWVCFQMESMGKAGFIKYLKYRGVVGISMELPTDLVMKEAENLRKVEGTPRVLYPRIAFLYYIYSDKNIHIILRKLIEPGSVTD